MHGDFWFGAIGAGNTPFQNVNAIPSIQLVYILPGSILDWAVVDLHARIEVVPSHPHILLADDFLHFVELDEFTQDWSDLSLSDTDMWDLCHAIMESPDTAPVIAGTGGLRKLRYSPVRWHKGKSGSIRVCYAYFPKYWLVLLVMAYGKGTQENMTAREKQGIKSYLEQTERWLASRRQS